MMNLSKVCEAATETNDLDELYRLLERVLAYECGYDRVIFSLMSNHVSLNLPAGHGIMRNYPDDWMKYYAAHGYEHLDPVRRFGFSHVGPFIWDQLPLVMDLSRRQNLCLNLGREAGLNNGAAICLRGVMGESAGIGCASSTSQGKIVGKELKHRLSLLNAISHQFYVAFCALHERKANFAEKQIELTERELQIVRLLAAGKSDSVIAQVLGTTESGVNFHNRNIFRKFGVSNRITAVMKVVHSGIVGPDEAVFLRRN
jgi:DNA-binding CsgD family transcriptional regulator